MMPRNFRSRMIPALAASPRKLMHAALLLALSLVLTSCWEQRKTDAELGLTAQQSVGRRVFDNNCARCHEPYSTRGLQGPSLHRLFKKQYLPSGAPANDERVISTIQGGRAKMPAFGQSLSPAQLAALLDYLKTL